MATHVIQVLLVILMIVFGILIIIDYGKNKEPMSIKDRVLNFVVSILLNILDVLGIGTFATSTAFYRLTKMVEDKKIPGTLVVGCILPVLTEGLAMVTNVEVETVTLVSMLVCSVAGAFIGSRINEKLPVRGIRLTMGIGLLIAGILMIGTLLSFLPAGGDARGLSGIRLVLSCAIVFVIGVFYPLGIGSYAPTLVLVSLMGMNPTVAFPIMMCGAGFNSASSFVNFIKSGEFHRRVSFGFNIGGVIGVLIAVIVVISLPMQVLRWIVVAVVLYTSVTMFLSAARKE